MKYFLDTEFHEYEKNGIDTIELISIGIVCEDGREFYAESADFHIANAEANTWLKENVLANLKKSEDQRWSNVMIAANIRVFIEPFHDDKPEFYGYYCDYDWVVFCWLFGRMIDLPTGYPMYCKDLKQYMDDFAHAYWMKHMVTTKDKLTPDILVKYLKSDKKYPQQTGEHNALDDARWNFELYKFLKSI